MSLAVPLSPPPVLSPTRQSDGRPARTRFIPVLLASSHCVSCSARFARQRVTEQKAPHVAQHGVGRGRVAWIAGRGLVERGLDPVEPRQPVTQGTRIGGQGRRSAEACQHQVARRVVAQRNRRRADFRHRQAGGPDMILGDRRIGDEILVGEDDAAIQPFLAAIDARKHQRGGEELEGAGEREALVAAVTGCPAARRVERRHTEATAVSAFEVGKRRAGVVGESRQCQQRSGKYRAACNRSRNRRLHSGKTHDCTTNMARSGHVESARAN